MLSTMLCRPPEAFNFMKFNMNQEQENKLFFYLLGARYNQTNVYLHSVEPN